MNKLKFVLVGCGRIATLHVAGYQDRKDAQLFGVYDKNISTAQKFAADHQIPKVYNSYEEVLADNEVAAVELIVPHHLHCAMTIQACEAGKHVSVQKPMALNLEECDLMIAAAKKNHVKLKVFENFVHYPPYLLVKEMIAAGEIGEIQGIRYKMNNSGLNSNNFPKMNLGLLKDKVEPHKELESTGWKVDPHSWMWRLNDTLAGGGPVIFDDGYHKFSVFIDLLGEVEKVTAWIDETPVMANISQDSPAVIMWKYKNKKLYGVWDITNSKDMYIKGKYYTCDERLEITGSRGVLWITRCTAEMLTSVAPVVMYRDGELINYWDVPCDWQDSFIHSTHDFIDAIIEDKEPILTGEKGREVLKFALAAIDSSNKKQEIYLDNYEDKEVPKHRRTISLLFFPKKNHK